MAKTTVSAEQLQAVLAEMLSRIEGNQPEPAEDKHVARFVSRRNHATNGAKPQVKLSADAQALVHGKDGLDGVIDPADFIAEYISDPKNRMNKKTGETYDGCHVVFSGLMHDFGQMFPGADFIQITDQMAADKLVVKRPVRGGYWLIPAELARQKPEKSAATKISPALARLLERFAKSTE